VDAKPPGRSNLLDAPLARLARDRSRIKLTYPLRTPTMSHTMLQRLPVSFRPKLIQRLRLSTAQPELRPARLQQWRDIFVPRSRGYTGRLMAAVYADMVDYSRLFRLDDGGTIARLRRMRSRIAPAIRRHRGHLVQTAGDSMLIMFDSIIEAIKCALSIQCELACENDGWPDDRRMRFRVGVDFGDVVADGRDFHGDGIIIAVRLQEVCPPGAVCISRAVHDRGGSRLDLPFQALGSLNLKHVPQPVEAFVIRPSRDATTATLCLVGDTTSVAPDPPTAHLVASS
jgi:class 3 adenylate cyclase